MHDPAEVAHHRRRVGLRPTTLRPNATPAAPAAIAVGGVRERAGGIARIAAGEHDRDAAADRVGDRGGRLRERGLDDARAQLGRAAAAGGDRERVVAAAA